MDYVSKWMRLSEAVTAAVRLSKDEAQSWLCRAIAEGAVAIRGKLKEHSTKHMTSNVVLDGKDFQIPAEIKPKDLDWEASRPVLPWIVRRGAFEPSGSWHLEWIELLRTDVQKVLSPRQQGEASRQASTSEAGDKGRSRPPLQSTGADAAGPRAAGSARRRGARPKKFEQVRDAMRDDIRQGRCTVQELNDMLEKNLAAAYAVSRDTARKARNAVLAEFGRV